MLELTDVSSGYGRIRVLERVSAAFAAGSVTAVVGLNGSGKSTLLKTVAGLCDLAEGKLTLDGRSLSDLSGRERARLVSYLPQSRPTPAITVERMVLHGRFPYMRAGGYGEADRECCEAAMRRVGICGLRSRQVGELSGGERQKVYLAMALAGQAGVLLFDEPTTYLDIERQTGLFAILCELRGEGKTVVAVLHDLDLALRAADSVLVLERGRIAASGSPDELLARGVIDEVFHVRCGSFTDDVGNTHYFFDRRLE